MQHIVFFCATLPHLPLFPNSVLVPTFLNRSRTIFGEFPVAVERLGLRTIFGEGYRYCCPGNLLFTESRDIARGPYGT